MPKTNQSSKQRKVGRNSTKCERYRKTFRRERNKERRLAKREARLKKLAKKRAIGVFDNL